MSAENASYDPFARGRFPVGVRTIEIPDAVRARRFRCEIWYPAAAHAENLDSAPQGHDVFAVPSSPAPRTQMAARDAAAQRGSRPLIVFSHPSGGHRRTATFLCTHLGSHGYVVAALDHSDVSAAELAPRDAAAEAQKSARVESVVASRVPDIRLLLAHLLGSAQWAPDISLDPARI
jgi:predicted dienelactone hydrolase